MELIEHLGHLTRWDWGAAAFIVLGWFVIGSLIDRPGGKRPSVTALMSVHRREWMKVFVTRNPRIYDSQILASLRQSTSFFASTCLLAMGGLLALIGNTDPLRGVALEVTDAPLPVVVWQLKLGLAVLFLANAFLKFVWSNRVFGYCAVVMSAVPNDPEDPIAYPRAAQAAELNIRAAVNFNRGLRAMYFALAALAWLLGAFALIGATLIALAIVWSREFASVPRAILLEEKS